MDTTAAKIAAARNAAGKPYEADAYAAAQRALDAALLSVEAAYDDMHDAEQAICKRYGVSINEHGTWIVD